ncbi:T9SS type A sorting domain-containing protein, partial [Flammeovirga sp. OC4]|uniref:T9SS type A sorting domain-containing protein n=1 Tax=Flammeovirga sp. OC4 TaxID=1382345 RepID=UPI0005C4ED89
DLDTLFEDIDGQPLTYTITLENESVVDFTSSSSNYFIFTPKSIGSSAVTITASDQYSEIAQTFDITVLNRQPHLMQRIEPQELYLTDTGFNVDLDTLFEDIDGQPLTYTITLENESLVDFTSSSLNHFTFIPKSIGSSEVTITASDQYSEVAQTFDITVLNRSPHLLQRVESQELYLTDSGFNIDLDTLFEDIDGQPLTYTIALENESVVDFTSSSLNHFTFIPKSIGSSEVTITASDQYSEVAQTFDITVLNRSPHLLQRVESQELYLTDSGFNIDLDTLFEDIDGQPLTYTIALENESLVDFTSSSLNHFTFIPKSIGSSEVTITASDQYSEIAQVFDITVLNRSPHLMKRIEPQELYLTDSGFNVDLDTLFKDIDGQPLTYTIALENESVVDFTSSSSNHFTFIPKSIGSSEVTITASDQYSEVAQTFDITVLNRQPHLMQKVESQELYLTDLGFNVDLDTLFEDIDDHSLTYSIELENEEVVDFTSSSSNYIIFTPKSIGSSAVTITASDQYSEVAQTFDITVLNRQPHLMKSVEPQELYLTDSGFNVDLDTLFEDIDGQPLTYTITLENESLVDFTSSSLNHFTFIPKSIGSSEVTITASDQYSEIAQVFDITVLNRSPHLMKRIEPQELYLTDSGFNVDLDTLFKDIDGQPLTYTIALENESLVDFTSSSLNHFTFIPKSIGSSEVTITASDQYSEIAQVFDITVLNRSPHLMKRIEPQELYLTDSGFNVDLDTLFKDIDGQPLTYTIALENESVVDFTSSSSNHFTFIPKSIGSSEVTITASDQYSEVAQTFDITVLNRQPHLMQKVESQELYLTDLGFNVDLDTLFEDIDDHSLTYSIELENEEVVDFTSSSSNYIIFTPKSIGSSAVTITASDQYSEVAQIFEIAVLNQIPYLITNFEDKEYYLSDRQFKLYLDDYFIDEDLHTLSYEVSSNNSTFIDFTISNAELAIQFNESGEGTVSIEAMDSFGGSHQSSFNLTVLEDTITALSSTEFIEVHVYPNPVRDVVHLLLNKYVDTKSIKLFDGAGKEMTNLNINHTITSKGNNYTITTDNFSSGIYFIRIEITGFSSFSSKFIIK